MAIPGTTGTTFEIGTKATDAASDTYTSVAGATQLGVFGDSATLISFITLDDSRVRKQKGSRNAGQLNPQFAFDALNAGIQAVVAAGADDSATPYNMRITLTDTPASGSAPTATVFTFKGFVMGTPLDVSQADNPVTLSPTIEIDTIVSLNLAATGD
ncbi:MAG: hypothetical protein AAF968_05485 [Pseudomonadota bacterium]